MIDKEGYWYKNDTLIDRLRITKVEKIHMITTIGIDETLNIPVRQVQ